MSHLNSKANSHAQIRVFGPYAISELGLFAAHLFGYSGDIAFISHANRKASLAQDKDERQAAEKFILAASADDTEDEGRFVQTPIRFPSSLLARIDRAAKKRGLNRSSWIRYAATKELDVEDL